MEAQAGSRSGWQAESEGLVVLKDQPEVTQPGAKVQDMGRGLDLKFNYLSCFVNQAQVADEGRPAQVGFDVGLKLDQPFGQFDQQPVLLGLLEDQQA